MVFNSLKIDIINNFISIISFIITCWHTRETIIQHEPVCIYNDIGIRAVICRYISHISITKILFEVFKIFSVCPGKTVDSLPGITYTK